MDQLRSYYDVGRTGMKWWKYVFWGMLNITIINAYIACVNLQRPLPSNLKPFSLKAFKLKLVHALCDGYNGRKRGVKGAVDVAVDHVIFRNLKPGHSLVKFSGRKRGCVACRRSGRKAKCGRGVETTFGCSTCAVPLCKLGPCFQEFHGML